MIKYFYKSLRTDHLQELEKPQRGTWVYAEAPTEVETEALIKRFNLDTGHLEDEAAEPLLYDPNNPAHAYVLDELPSRPEFEPTGELRGRAKGYAAVIVPALVIAANLLVLALKMDWL